MPLVNVIRGERIEPAPLHVRPPIWRIPLWLAICWGAVKGLVSLVRLAVRWWYVSMPAAVAVWLLGRYGWRGVAIPSATLGILLGVWAAADLASFVRFVCWPVVGRWRRMRYRRSWQAATVTTGLAVRFDDRVVLPVIRRVRSSRWADVVTVRMVTGQIPDDYAAMSLTAGAHVQGRLMPSDTRPPTGPGA